MARTTAGPTKEDPWADPPKGRKAIRAAKKQAKREAKKGKTRWYKQLWQVYKMTAKVQPLIGLWMGLMFLGIVGAGTLFGVFVMHNFVYMLIISLPAGLLAAMILLARRAERAAYSQIEGRPGAAYSALGQIRRGWTIEEEPVALDPRSQDMVFRAVGRPGVVLVGDGAPGRVRNMMKKERQKVARIAPGVVVTELVVGDGEDQVPLRKLARKVQRLRPSLTRAELTVVTKRLQSVGGLKLPVPKGMDPMRARIDRKAMRGR
jgi:hypothetical protein